MFSEKRKTGSACEQLWSANDGRSEAYLCSRLQTLLLDADPNLAHGLASNTLLLILNLSLPSL